MPAWSEIEIKCAIDFEGLDCCVIGPEIRDRVCGFRRFHARRRIVHEDIVCQRLMIPAGSARLSRSPTNGCVNRALTHA